MRRYTFLRSAQRGATLIEVIVALVIGSIISLLLYQLFSYSIRCADQSGRLMDDYTDRIIAANQMERDVASIVVPLMSHTVTGTHGPQEQETTKGPAEQEQAKNNGQALFCTGTEQQLGALAFYSTNALPQVGNPASRLVWIQYFLAPEQRDEQAHATTTQLFSLMRQEVPLYHNVKKQSVGAKAYPVLLHIEHIACICYYHESMPADGAANKQSRLPAASPLRSLSTWNTRKDKKLPQLPEYIELRGISQSTTTKESIPFSFLMRLPAANFPTPSLPERKS